MQRSHFLTLSIICIFTIFACSQDKRNTGDAPTELSQNQETNQHISIIAHRGDSWNTPENTLASVQSAWQKNADAVEVDVYLTADNRVMAIHDKTTERTGDKVLTISESTSEELRKIDAGSWKGEEFTGERIPFLEEIIESVPAGEKKLFIEIKGSAETLPSYVKDIIDKSGKADQMIIIAFDLDIITKSKQIMPNVPAYWLLSAPRDDEGNYQPIDTKHIATAKKHNLDGLDINYRGISQKLVDEIRQENMGIYVWTVNEPSDIKRMAAFGVDGITTDRIQNAQQVLR